MKQNIAKVFTFSLLASSISFISCVDNEKNLFDADQLKQIYEETFPVKNIDLDGDWTVSRSVIACVSVNGDQGVDYKIQIFDADPLSPGSTAKLLAEGTVNQDVYKRQILCSWNFEPETRTFSFFRFRSDNSSQPLYNDTTDG